MDRTLTWFIRIWIALAVLINVAAIFGLLLTAPTLGEGWSQVRDIYSPFNVVNYIAEVALFSPALIAMRWRDRRRKTSHAKSLGL